MSTKRKSRAGASSEAEDGSTDTLTEFLEDFITEELIAFQATGRQALHDTLIDLLHPQRSQVFDLLGQVAGRMNAVQTKLQEERGAKRLYSWVFPAAAAVLFEGVFESCASVWIVAGESADPSQLKPAVAECIRVEVRAFVTVVGGTA